MPNGGLHGTEYVDNLAEARRRVLEGLEEGVTCPCCGQLAKQYRRSIYRGMARWLVQLIIAHRGKEWVSIHDLPVQRGGDFAKLALWGLIQQKPNDDDDSKRTSGMWRPTRLGRRFAFNETKVPKYLYIFDGAIRERSVEEVFIRECFQTRFDYRDTVRSLDEVDKAQPWSWLGQQEYLTF
jgi:hypothetical protein